MRDIIHETEVLEMDIPLAMILFEEDNDYNLKNMINSLNRIGLRVIRRNGSVGDSIFLRESS